MMREWAWAAGAAVLALVSAAGCQRLPEPESEGAKLYQRRCSGCHRLYLPGSMTVAMWDVQIERMQREFTRRGMKPLSGEERSALLGYLGKHSQGVAGG